MSEEEAVCLLKKNNEKAFEFLYRKYWAKVYNFTKLYITSVSDAEEIVHEVFVKLWEARMFVNEDKNFDGFLFIITRNLIFNRSRKSFNQVFYQVTIAESMEETYNVEDELAASDLRNHINSLIELMPPRRQEIFRLSREKQLSYKEIAELLDISEKTVEHHIADALKFLKRNMELYLIFCNILP